MKLSTADKKKYRTIGHQLDPIVTISENGISEGVINELNRALSDHELIKVKLAIADRDARAEVARVVAGEVRAELVQVIGKVILLLRRNSNAKPNLSNLVRHGLS
ncbi:ribosome assembly RNA-binding protein YhbY [Salinibius halmophilus]|uniref:ribosome assembly RNA-binding protein YhbY n=1 Tax=Salinibius halmophilus TaxID=1853216 RepID=UPI000E66DEC1|nr:ribosome assembly RNA-binding protein YhbY [Salinibius halmophilus]